MNLSALLLVGAALFFTANTIYLFFASNFNFGVLSVAGLAFFFWALFLFRRPVSAFLRTPLGHIVGILFAVFAAMVLALIAFVAVSGYYNKPKGNEKALIVLGAALHGDKVSRILQYRLDAAAEYYFDHPDVILVTTGGQGVQELMPEGRAMREYLIRKGVSPEHVFAEEKSTSTEENFAFSLSLLKAAGIEPSEPVALVTNAFHCFRASLYARAQGFANITALPAGISPGSILPSYIREAAALVYCVAFRLNKGPVAGVVSDVVERTKDSLYIQ